MNTKLTKKSIPSLELQGITLSAQSVTDIFVQLSGDDKFLPVTVTPIIRLY